MSSFEMILHQNKGILLKLTNIYFEASVNFNPDYS